MFGGAIDQGLNVLLETRDLAKSLAVFEKAFRFGQINYKEEYLPTSPKVSYSDKDLEKDLISFEGWKELNRFAMELGYDRSMSSEEVLKEILSEKKRVGYDSLSLKDRQYFNLACWLSLFTKGQVILRDYEKQVLPKIKQVISIQEPIDLDNGHGDSITGIIDLVAVWEDGNTYVLDNKTSAIQYEKDSALRSQQLILYYHAKKHEYNLKGVGYIVASKRLNMNKTKACSKCGHDGTGTRFKTCNNELNGRCGGEWIEKLSPETEFQVILDEVNPFAEDLIIQTFDEANTGISNGFYPPNLQACMAYNRPCPYMELCYKGKNANLETVVIDKPTKV